ncbi:MAG: lysophospholipid acyltransferase family protein [Ferruginibacter sp.]
MPFISAVFRVLFTIWGFLLFVTFLLLIFPLVVIASFFGKIRGGNFMYRLCRYWTEFLLFFTRIRTIYIYDGARPDPGTQYVFVFNHISYLDIPFLMKAIRGRHFRVLGKAELAKLPIFGFLYRCTVVLVDRSNASARAKSVLQLKSILRKGISVVISPEGTFNMTGMPLKEFYDGAFKIAIETQTPIKPVLFLDAYDRLPYQSIFSLNPGKSRIVYLDEIPVDGYRLEDTKKLKEKVYQLMEEKLVAYKASWISNEQKR